MLHLRNKLRMRVPARSWNEVLTTDCDGAFGDVQIGKSGASWVTQALLLFYGSISAAMPVIAGIFGCVVTSFFFAVNGLRKEMLVSIAIVLWSGNFPFNLSPLQVPKNACDIQ